MKGSPPFAIYAIYHHDLARVRRDIVRVDVHKVCDNCQLSNKVDKVEDKSGPSTGMSVEGVTFAISSERQQASQQSISFPARK